MSLLNHLVLIPIYSSLCATVTVAQLHCHSGTVTVALPLHCIQRCETECKGGQLTFLENDEHQQCNNDAPLVQIKCNNIVDGVQQECTTNLAPVHLHLQCNNNAPPVQIKCNNIADKVQQECTTNLAPVHLHLQCNNSAHAALNQRACTRTTNCATTDCTSNCN